MKQTKLYEVEVVDVMRINEFELELIEQGVEYKRFYDKFIIGDLDFIGMLHKDMVKIRSYKEGSYNLTKEEMIREVERDIEAVIFQYKQQCKNDEETHYGIPDWRKADYLHMSRALKILDQLKEIL